MIMKLILRVVLLCFMALSFLPGAALALSHDPPLDQFEFAIKKFEADDRVAMPVPGRTLFIGSSTFAHWLSLEKDLGDCRALNRGFGGSTIPEVNFYADRVAIKYKPARVVFYAGTNDIANGHTAKQVFDDFSTFANKVHAALPQTQVYFVSMSVAPSRMQWKSVYDEGNELVRAYAKQTSYVHYIDVIPVMRTADGKLKDEYFLPDRLHMNSEGYAQWTPIIRAALTGDGKEAK